jgi:Ner family transcriptional regulator
MMVGRTGALVQKLSTPDGSLSGWHPEDVKAAIRKTGVSLTELALRNGLDESYIRQTLQRPLPRGEQIIAAHLGLEPKIIWPDRYDLKTGKPDYPKWRRLRDERLEANKRARAA